MKRVALVTGFSRQAGIATGVVERLLSDGMQVLATGWAPHDAEMPWGVDDAGNAALASSLDPDAESLVYVDADLESSETPAELVAATVERFGAIDAVVAAHARSSHANLADVTATELDRCWAVNTRASLLLAQQFGTAYDESRGAGRVLFFTSGQHIDAMGDEIAYAVSKGAIQQMTASVADQLADRGITVNCINPGPVDTGWATGGFHDAVAGAFPAGRWGTPADIANLVSFLASDEGGWITGQTLNTEGGFRRSQLHTPPER